MSYKRELLLVLREVAGAIDGLRIALVEREADISHRVGIVETEQKRLERRFIEHKRDGH